jgi:hypothetical protein
MCVLLRVRMVPFVICRTETVRSPVVRVARDFYNKDQLRPVQQEHTEDEITNRSVYACKRKYQQWMAVFIHW